MIERTEYLNELKRWKDKDLIKIVTEIRKCGKSTLFELFINFLKENNIKDEQIIHINLEDADNDFKSYKELYNYINNKLDPKKQYYVFLDEVQNVLEFQKAVDSLYIKKNVDVYITGSNAYLLSGELATLLSGRYIEIKMLPLSFKEYVTAFIESFLIYKAERFDVKGKKLLARDYKYYVVDSGLRSYLLGKKDDSDKGHILENIVYLELLRRGYKVYVGKVDDLEVDFVAENRDGLKYYQVALTVRDENVLERELRSLQKTGDHYQKILLTLDMDLEADYEGITKINILDWLLKEE